MWYASLFLDNNMPLGIRANVFQCNCGDFKCLLPQLESSEFSDLSKRACQRLPQATHTAALLLLYALLNPRISAIRLLADNTCQSVTLLHNENCRVSFNKIRKGKKHIRDNYSKKMNDIIIFYFKRTSRTTWGHKNWSGFSINKDQGCFE